MIWGFLLSEVMASLALASAGLSGGAQGSTTGRIQTMELTLDLDRDGAADQVTLLAHSVAERAWLTIRYATGKSETPLILQFRKGDNLSLELLARSDADPHCKDWPNVERCAIYASHTPVPSFAVHSSRQGTVLVGYDDPTWYEARPKNPDGSWAEADHSRGQAVLFLPFDE